MKCRKTICLKQILTIAFKINIERLQLPTDYQQFQNKMYNTAYIAFLNEEFKYLLLKQFPLETFSDRPHCNLQRTCSLCLGYQYLADAQKHSPQYTMFCRGCRGKR
ncbi:hypothetical protein CEXT_617591 [Caerostris extrusa]|uniref:Uncharacterized protein n=1 Tax=Caerostris extrusa TaxID=172846 RepID=A0AAV4PVH5_CAEEX|nr:hypothetical protein CEXT_617591 [Caerostris extrusa]